MTELYPCLKCGKEPHLVQTFGQWTVNCPCGVKLGHRFFNRQTAIDQWNRSGHESATASLKRDEKRAKTLLAQIKKKETTEAKAKAEEARKTASEKHSARIKQQMRRRRLYRLPDDTLLFRSEAAFLICISANRLKKLILSGQLESTGGVNYDKTKLRKGDVVKWRLANPPNQKTKEFKKLDFMLKGKERKK